MLTILIEHIELSSRLCVYYTSIYTYIANILIGLNCCSCDHVILILFSNLVIICIVLYEIKCIDHVIGMQTIQVLISKVADKSEGPQQT